MEIPKNTQSDWIDAVVQHQNQLSHTCWQDGYSFVVGGADSTPKIAFTVFLDFAPNESIYSEPPVEDEVLRSDPVALENEVIEQFKNLAMLEVSRLFTLFLKATGNLPVIGDRFTPALLLGNLGQRMDQKRAEATFEITEREITHSDREDCLLMLYSLVEIES